METIDVAKVFMRFDRTHVKLRVAYSGMVEASKQSPRGGWRTWLLDRDTARALGEAFVKAADRAAFMAAQNDKSWGVKSTGVPGVKLLTVNQGGVRLKMTLSKDKARMLAMALTRADAHDDDEERR